MRMTALALIALSLACIAGCGSDDGGRDAAASDLAAPAEDASGPDLAVVADLAMPDQLPPANPDQAPGCTPQTILDGTSTVAAQGWTVTGTASAITTDGLLVDFTTKGVATGTTTSAQALLSKNVGIANGAAWALEWRLKVIASDGHNALDAPVAFMGSFTAPFGAGAERAQMIYFDVAAVGWADDAQSYAVDTRSFHVYRLDVSAGGHAELRVDGTLALARDNFTTNGVIAVGDQTNDANVDSQFELYQARKLCP